MTHTKQQKKERNKETNKQTAWNLKKNVLIKNPTFDHWKTEKKQDTGHVTTTIRIPLYYLAI